MTLNNLLVRLQCNAWIFGNVEYPFIAPLPDPFWTRVVVPDRALSIDLIELFDQQMQNLTIRNKTACWF